MMDWIVMLMLVVDVAIILVAVWTLSMTSPASTPAPARRRSGLAISLTVGSLISLDIADKHPGPGAELIHYASGVLLGMGISIALVLMRQRLGRGAAA